MSGSSVQSSTLADWFLKKGLDTPEEQESLHNVFNQLFNTGEIVLSSLDVIILLNLVKDAQELRLPDSSKGRKPAGVVDPRTGERDRSVPAHESWMTPQLTAHYLMYATAVYGSSYIYGLKDSGGFFRWIGNMFRTPGRVKPANIDFDDTRENYDVIKRLTSLKDEDLVYLTYENDLIKKPFMITLDHEEKSILVSIRGTISKADWVTDLMMTPSRLISIEGGEEVNEANYVHEGMLESALHLKTRLLGDYVPADEKEANSYQTGLLVRAVHQLENRVNKDGNKIGKDGAKAYRLVITGHSLGAGVAAILAVLLRKDFPESRCFAFSPPGCLMSESVVNYSSTFVASITLGDDIVARAGVSNAYDLKIKMFQTLRAHPAIGLRSLVINNEKSDILNMLIDKEISETQERLRDTTKLYLPGRVMYLEEIQKSTIFGTRTYAQHFCNNRDEIFSELLLSEYIVSHHIPWRLLDGLKYIS